uniref:Uncharacterized protein n=1 Tax=Octopus bimaculoides TaxID=37653 RepID=A0A0L8HRX0_OCTBM
MMRDYTKRSERLCIFVYEKACKIVSACTHLCSGVRASAEQRFISVCVKISSYSCICLFVSLFVPLSVYLIIRSFVYLCLNMC